MRPSDNSLVGICLYTTDKTLINPIVNFASIYYKEQTLSLSHKKSIYVTFEAISWTWSQRRIDFHDKFFLIEITSERQISMDYIMQLRRQAEFLYEFEDIIQ